MNNTVTMTIDGETFARRWAYDNSKCMVDWLVLDELIRNYDGPKGLVFNSDKCTYEIVRD